MKSVELHIAGQRYVIRSDADETYVRSLGHFVEQRLKAVQKQSKVVPTQQLVVLAALNIADELFQQRSQHAALKRDIKQRATELLGYVKQQLRRLPQP